MAVGTLEDLGQAIRKYDVVVSGLSTDGSPHWTYATGKAFPFVQQNLWDCSCIYDGWSNAWWSGTSCERRRVWNWRYYCQIEE